jgi:uncharacterized protein (DUF2225 family)/CRP-like cAMP-binding protein
LINFHTLKKLTRVKKYPKGSAMAASGEMYVVLKGEAGIFPEGRKEPEISIGPGGFFGESALFLSKRAPYSAVALTDVIALPVGKGEAADFVREEPDFTMELMKAMCERLETVSAALEQAGGHPWASSAHAHKEHHPAKEHPAAAKPQEAPTAQPEERKEAAAPQAPAQASEAPAAPAGQSFSLFPEEHGSYSLPLENVDQTMLMDKSYTCPLCRHEFKAHGVRSSRLVQVGTDSDMRNRYKGIEPLYYDVTTCPGCLYSALADMFRSPDMQRASLKQELQAFRPALPADFGANLDAFTVFAGYYLALYCAPKSFTTHPLATAKLLLKLSRVYQDCGDGHLEQVTARRALDAYMKVYLNGDAAPELDQQLCLVIGELYLKMKDFKNARDFFFKAKTNRSGTPLLKNQAENRLLAIRTTEA